MSTERIDNMNVEKVSRRALKDRPEFKTKLKPLTCMGNTTVQVAVELMSEKNFGSVVVTDSNQLVIGVLTERDIMKKLVNERKKAEETLVSDIMTKDVKVARETDDVLDWLRIMSNETFRRLPVVDDAGRVVCVFTQGDFVSYTWPDLIFQAKELAKAGVMKNFPVWLFAAGVCFYT
jgi:CBS domain-containing protein